MATAEEKSFAHKAILATAEEKMLHAKHIFLSRQRPYALIEADFALSEHFLLSREARCPLQKSKSLLEERKSPLQEDIFLCRRIFSSARGDSPSLVEFSFGEARRQAEHAIVSLTIAAARRPRAAVVSCESLSSGRWPPSQQCRIC